MITNHDIEIAFVRAQKRINERIENAQAQFYMDDVIQTMETLTEVKVGKDIPMDAEKAAFINNPIANEEI